MIFTKKNQNSKQNAPKTRISIKNLKTRISLKLLKKKDKNSFKRLKGGSTIAKKDLQTTELCKICTFEKPNFLSWLYCNSTSSYLEHRSKKQCKTIFQILCECQNYNPDEKKNGCKPKNIDLNDVQIPGIKSCLNLKLLDDSVNKVFSDPVWKDILKDSRPFVESEYYLLEKIFGYLVLAQHKLRDGEQVGSYEEDNEKIRNKNIGTSSLNRLHKYISSSYQHVSSSFDKKLKPNKNQDYISEVIYCIALGIFDIIPNYRPLKLLLNNRDAIPSPKETQYIVELQQIINKIITTLSNYTKVDNVKNHWKDCSKLEIGCIDIDHYKSIINKPKETYILKYLQNLLNRAEKKKKEQASKIAFITNILEKLQVINDIENENIFWKNFDNFLDLNSSTFDQSDAYVSGRSRKITQFPENYYQYSYIDRTLLDSISDLLTKIKQRTNKLPDNHFITGCDKGKTFNCPINRIYFSERSDNRIKTQNCKYLARLAKNYGTLLRYPPGIVYPSFIVKMKPRGYEFNYGSGDPVQLDSSFKNISKLLNKPTITTDKSIEIIANDYNRGDRGEYDYYFYCGCGKDVHRIPRVRLRIGICRNCSQNLAIKLANDLGKDTTSINNSTETNIDSNIDDLLGKVIPDSETVNIKNRLLALWKIEQDEDEEDEEDEEGEEDEEDEEGEEDEEDEEDNDFSQFRSPKNKWNHDRELFDK